MPLQLSGSLDISGSVTAENITLTSDAPLAGTASWAVNVVNGGGGAGFPYFGNAVITGSLLVAETTSVVQMLPNPTFDGNTDGWILGTDVVYYQNNVSCSYTGGQPYLYTNNFTVQQGAQYDITFTLSNVQNDTLYAAAYNNFNAGNNNAGLEEIGDGTYQISFTSSFTGDEYLFFDLWNYNTGATYILDDAFVYSDVYSGGITIIGNTIATGSIVSTLGFTGSLEGTASWAMNSMNLEGTASWAMNVVSGSGGSISTLGTTLYSTNPVAGPNFSTQNSIIFGDSAGEESTASSSSIFLGKDAGRYSDYSWHSNFLGESAGYNSLSAGYNNFFGFEAGANVTSTQYSNFIGFRAGKRENFSQGSSNANYIGQEAGYNSYAQGANFVGLYSGYGTSASFSNFIGSSAGYGAIEAYQSNFIGYFAGKDQLYASHSIFIGFQAGWYEGTNRLGSNNIIIGNNITLPDQYSNAMNLGGLIFGSGSRPSEYGYPSTDSANGKIGINQPLPQYSLDVSGSIGLSDVLVLATRDTLPAIAPTGSIMVSGSGANNKPYYWNGSTWTALF